MKISVSRASLNLCVRALAIGETLYDKGVLDITNIDFSEVLFPHSGT